MPVPLRRKQVMQLLRADDRGILDIAGKALPLIAWRGSIQQA